MILAERLHWTEAEIDATDPDLIGELLAYIRADDDHRRVEAEEARRKRG